MSCSWVSGKVSGRCSGSEPRSLLWPGDHLSRLNRTANVVKGRFLAKQQEIALLVPVTDFKIKQELTVSKITHLYLIYGYIF